MSLAASRWRECNRSLAWAVKKAHWDEHFGRPAVLDDSAVGPMAYARDLFLRHGAQMFLARGTLLGWHRECGIIPFTTDIDTAVMAAQWSPALERALLSQRQVHRSQDGLPRPSKENY